MQSRSDYYIPSGSYWPILGSVGMFAMLFMVFGWLGQVVHESENGFYNKEVDGSFRMGMFWFIFSEVMFFAAFFGALFYARQFSVPWLAGEGNNFWTGELLWPEFKSSLG